MKRNSGFSLIEAILAIGILSVMLVQIVSIHSNSLAASQSAINNMKATWALRQGMAQLEYVLDVYGSKQGSMFQNIKVPWGADPEFSINVATKDSPIEASRLLVSAFRIGTAFAGGGQEPEGEQGADPAEAIKGFADQINSFVPRDIYRSLNIEVTWKQGDQNKGLDTGFFLIDSKSLKLGGGMLDMLNKAGGGTDGVVPSEEERK